MTPERYRRITRVLDQRQPDLTVLTDGVRKTHNLAAIVRTCDAVGIPELHAVHREERFYLSRFTTRGSHHWVRVRLHRDARAAIRALQQGGMQVVAAHLSADAVDFRALDYTRPTCVVMGTEHEGVSAEAAAAVDGHVQVPMHGMVESFNVSVAAAIILMEAERQRRAAGFYDAPRLDPERYRRQLFEWGYPRLAAFCRERGLDYPALDDQGALADGSEWYRRVQAGEFDDHR